MTAKVKILKKVANQQFFKDAGSIIVTEDEILQLALDKFNKKNKSSEDIEYTAEPEYLNWRSTIENNISKLPENMPLYRDSGLWQLRTDDMDGVMAHQGVGELFSDFIKRCVDILEGE